MELHDKIMDLPPVVAIIELGSGEYLVTLKYDGQEIRDKIQELSEKHRRRVRVEVLEW